MRRVEVVGGNGVVLVGDAYGRHSDPPVLLLHGGGQTRHSWGGTARELAAAGFYAVCADHRGHGDSGWDPEGDYEWSAFRADLESWSAWLTERTGRVPAVVGASLGGITALWTLGGRVEEGLDPAMSAIVLVDIAPRIEEEGADRILAFMRARPDGFASLEEAAETISQYLPHRPKPKDTTGLAKNLRLGDDGRYRWHWDPAWILHTPRRRASTRGTELADHARRIDIPTLLVRGRMSDLLSEEGAREFLALVSHAEYVDVAGAGHMVAGDRNDAFTAAVIEFLRRVTPA
jgi:pimeloyl-ACP methyl ester carboxylesterase